MMLSAFFGHTMQADSYRGEFCSSYIEKTRQHWSFSFSGALAGNPFNVDREFLAKGTYMTVSS